MQDNSVALTSCSVKTNKTFIQNKLGFKNSVNPLNNADRVNFTGSQCKTSIIIKHKKINLCKHGSVTDTENRHKAAMGKTRR